MKRLPALVAAAVLITGSANAGVIEYSDVNTYGTFQDTNTGRVWLDLDNFFGLTHNEMASLASSAGFTVAVRGDVEELLNTLPLPDAFTWDTYATIMGRAPNREMIWGSYDPVVSNAMGWAFAERGQASWTFNDFAWSADAVPNDGGEFEDMNIWAYADGEVAPVPEPGTWMLLGSGAVALVAMRRRRK